MGCLPKCKKIEEITLWKKKSLIMFLNILCFEMKYSK
jgi:hypothetical protein